MKGAKQLGIERGIAELRRKYGLRAVGLSGRSGVLPNWKLDWTDWTAFVAASSRCPKSNRSKTPIKTRNNIIYPTAVR
jgi:hypothetical protein